MKKIGRTFFVFGFVLLAVIQLSPVTALADVNVFAEGAYTATDLVVYIYADTTVGTATELRSAGVKLTYNTSELSNCTAEKNEDTWFLGDKPYMNPDTTTTAGQVVIILGKLDTDAPEEGVSGDRVLLGKVSFTHSELTVFTLNLDYGKRGPANEFKNFVATDQTVLDDSAVSFGTITVRQRGDANADGTVNVNDLRTLRQIIGDPDAPCYSDCNGDGTVNVNDLRCLRQNI